jgi:hypothetical protein
VKTLLKTLTSHAPHKPSSSKIYKELESLLINGNAKLNILNITQEGNDKVMAADDDIKGVRMPLMRNKKEKFNKMFIEYQTLREMID